MNVPIWVTAGLGALFLLYLAGESLLAASYRKRIKHIVHVNGIRGKSTVTRLIGAGLAAGGLRTITKTTGTLPMVIDASGVETLIKRRAPANIREQFFLLRKAAKSHADVLVIECMAIQPQLQYVCQHRILRADIGVITNVRYDHTDVMGETLEEIGDALMNTVPRNGVVATADETFFGRLEKKAESLGSRAILARPQEEKTPSGFPENEALALAVCQELGVDPETAEAGMATYHPDPYAFSVHPFGTNVFLNAFSCNDVESTERVYAMAKAQLQRGLPLVLLVNDRADRPERTKQMIRLAQQLQPQEVFLLGAHKAYLRLMLRRKLPGTPVHSLKNEQAFREDTCRNACILAVGNIKNEGMKLMERLNGQGEENHVR